MKIPLQLYPKLNECVPDHLEDIMLLLKNLPSVHDVENYLVNAYEDVDDLRCKFSDNLYDLSDHLINKYEEESFRAKNNA